MYTVHRLWCCGVKTASVLLVYKCCGGVVLVLLVRYCRGVAVMVLLLHRKGDVAMFVCCQGTEVMVLQYQCVVSA